MPPAKSRPFNEELLETLRDPEIVQQVVQLILPETIDNLKTGFLDSISNLTLSVKKYQTENSNLQNKILALSDENISLKLELESMKAALLVAERENTQSKLTNIDEAQNCQTQEKTAKAPSATNAYSNANFYLDAAKTCIKVSEAPPVSLPYLGPPLTRKERRKPKMLYGKRSPEGSEIKTYSKNSVFVGKLDINTTEEELKKYLEQRGVKDATCKRLKTESNDGRTFKSAAFFVSFYTDFIDIIFNEDTWPANTLVKEWVFKKQTNKLAPAPGLTATGVSEEAAPLNTNHGL